LGAATGRVLKAPHRLDTKTIGLDLEEDDARLSWSTMYRDFRSHLFGHMRQDACEWVTNNFETFLNDPRNTPAPSE